MPLHDRLVPCTAARSPPHLPTRCPSVLSSQPLPEGQERVKEDWEHYFPIGMLTGTFFLGFIYMNQPYQSIEDWAMDEALRRIAERKANGEEE